MSDQATTQANNENIHVYGADWCGDCRRAKAAFNEFGATFIWHDIETEEGAAEKAVAISDQKHIPVVTYPDGTFMVEPSANDIRAKLQELNLL